MKQGMINNGWNSYSSCSQIRIIAFLLIFLINNINGRALLPAGGKMQEKE